MPKTPSRNASIRSVSLVFLHFCPDPSPVVPAPSHVRGTESGLVQPHLTGRHFQSSPARAPPVIAGWRLLDRPLLPPRHRRERNVRHDGQWRGTPSGSGSPWLGSGCLQGLGTANLAVAGNVVMLADKLVQDAFSCGPVRQLAAWPGCDLVRGSGSLQALLPGCRSRACAVVLHHFVRARCLLGPWLDRLCDCRVQPESEPECDECVE